MASNGRVRVYLKGAPEVVLALCNQTLGQDLQPRLVDERHWDSVLEGPISEEMAREGLKVLSYAFKDMSVEDFNQFYSPHCDVESPEFRAHLEADMVYLGTFGLDDPLRANIEESVHYIRYGQPDGFDQVDQNQVNIRMVTGDHIETAKAIALRTGIIKPEELQINGIAMTGE